MSKLIILGSSDAIPTREHANTHLAILTGERTILLDCASNPVVRLEEAGIQMNAITDLILTHFHPDHVSGLPQLLMTMWLTGRRQPLNIYGLAYTLERVRTMMELYSWGQWPNFFPVNLHTAAETELALLLDTGSLQIHTTPLKHFIPVFGLRLEFRAEHKIVAYSCDTEPIPAILHLAQGANILIHEASGEQTGHTSPAQAGDLARQAEVGALYLIHYPSGRYAVGDPATEAQAHFPGPVRLATDFMEINLE